MRRTAGLFLAMALFLSACIPSLPFPQWMGAGSSGEDQATQTALAAALTVETLNLPTMTLPPSNTPVPTRTKTQPVAATKTIPPLPTHSATPQDTPTASAPLATLETSTLATPGDATLPAQSSPTATETLHPRTYGTLPPSIPYGKIELRNKSKTEVYVSLQCRTVDGYSTILEYPVGGTFRVSAPAGQYIYVAWVGGRKFEGKFKLDRYGEIRLTFEKNKVTVK